MARIFIVFDTDNTFNEAYRNTTKSFSFKGRDYCLAAAFEIGQQHKICTIGDADDLLIYGYMREVLSSLSWQERISVREIHSGANGQESTPCTVSESTCGPITPGRTICFVDIDNLFEPTSEEQAIALALYRQASNARWANYPLYSFLSYYKIIELAAPNVGETAIKAYLNELIATGVLNHQSQFTELTGANPGRGVRGDNDLAKSIYDHRQDCAHALRGSRTFNPDTYQYYRGLMLHIPVLETLAEAAMTSKLGITR